MKYSIISVAVATAALPTFTSAGPLLKERQSPQPTADDLNNAVLDWQADTQDVSSFLDFAASFTDADGSNSDFMFDALSATNSEKDELTHKAVIDSSDLAFEDARIAEANNTLVTMGTFQLVVNGLQDMANEGESVIASEVAVINADRCCNVLPAIDMYFAAVADFINSVNPDSPPVATQTAIRPQACATQFC